ncbi:MAG TPA: hypothetical protein P5136_00285 [Methanofastidiosum sp.]|nr:hypothetical protein [Methanofastidiosum sp.]
MDFTHIAYLEAGEYLDEPKYKAFLSYIIANKNPAYTQKILDLILSQIPVKTFNKSEVEFNKEGFDEYIGEQANTLAKFIFDKYKIRLKTIADLKNLIEKNPGFKEKLKKTYMDKNPDENTALIPQPITRDMILEALKVYSTTERLRYMDKVSERVLSNYTNLPLIVYNQFLQTLPSVRNAYERDILKQKLEGAPQEKGIKEGPPKPKEERAITGKPEFVDLPIDRVSFEEEFLSPDAFNYYGRGFSKDASQPISKRERDLAESEEYADLFIDIDDEDIEIGDYFYIPAYKAPMDVEAALVDLLIKIALDGERKTVDELNEEQKQRIDNILESWKTPQKKTPGQVLPEEYQGYAYRQIPEGIESTKELDVFEGAKPAVKPPVKVSPKEEAPREEETKAKKGTEAIYKVTAKFIREDPLAYSKTTQVKEKLVGGFKEVSDLIPWIEGSELDNPSNIIRLPANFVAKAKLREPEQKEDLGYLLKPGDYLKSQSKETSEIDLIIHQAILDSLLEVKKEAEFEEEMKDVEETINEKGSAKAKSETGDDLEIKKGPEGLMEVTSKDGKKVLVPSESEKLKELTPIVEL